MLGKGGKLSAGDKDKNIRDGALAHQHREKVCAIKAGREGNEGPLISFPMWLSLKIKAYVPCAVLAAQK